MSDLINVLTHRSVVYKLVGNDELLTEWFRIVALCQTMNVNSRAMIQHIEFESDAYVGAFAAEYELCSTPMFSIYVALSENAPAECHQHNAPADCRQDVEDDAPESIRQLDALANRLDKVRIVVQCVKRVLIDWLAHIGVRCDEPPQRGFAMMDDRQLTFHVPLQRNLAAFVGLHCGIVEAIRLELMTANYTEANTERTVYFDKLRELYERAIMSLLSADECYQFVQLSICVLSGYFQIQCGMWVRNGTQIRSQAITYQQPHFSEAMLDLDVFFLQFAASQINTITLSAR